MRKTIVPILFIVLVIGSLLTVIFLNQRAVPLSIDADENRSVEIVKCKYTGFHIPIEDEDLRNQIISGFNSLKLRKPNSIDAKTSTVCDLEVCFLQLDQKSIRLQFHPQESKLVVIMPPKVYGFVLPSDLYDKLDIFCKFEGQRLENQFAEQDYVLGP